MATRAQLVGALLELPSVDRAEAARSLLESLDREPHDDPADVEAAWAAEIAHRVEEIERGVVELVDGPTALRTLRERAQARLDRSRS